jgi:hypothetical protein
MHEHVVLAVKNGRKKIGVSASACKTRRSHRLSGTAADLVAKLPPGRIHAPGPGMVPTVREDLYEKLVATINPRGEAGQNPGEPTATDLPGSWDAIKPGHLVLAQDSLVEGWWAAVVVDRTGDKVTLRWRDYPGWPKFGVRATAVALIGPAGP